ncbi:hypothetical protein [Sphingobium fontiphilum]|nr:hypothetical protein [Sphingobium fontiphilum]
MIDAKAACQAEYDAALAAIINDADKNDERAPVVAHARARLDEADIRILEMLVPTPPTRLAQLPIRGMVGDWRLGGGALAVRMTVRYTDKPSIVGTLEPNDTTITTLNASGLRSWEIVPNERGSAILQATFADGRATKYARIPSSAGEMDFINAADSLVQRYDILLEDGELLIRWVEKDMSGQLRFRRQMQTGSEMAPK